jgi:hypothetical protein
MAKRWLPIVLVVVVVGVALYVRSLHSQLAALQKTDDKKPSAPTVPAPPRTLTDEQRQAMLGVLRGEGGQTRKIWFQVDLGKAEPVAFQKAIEQVFRDAGWDVDSKGAAGMTFKPGVYMLVGDEEWPADATTAYQAFQMAGIDVKAGSGYRDYYEQQKKEKPGWTGPKLGADQAFVVLIGANPGT